MPTLTSLLELLVCVFTNILKQTPLLVVLEAADKAFVDNTSKVTEDQLKTFLQLCWVKYVKARIEPGTPV